jgi:uncharacterized membrane protein
MNRKLMIALSTSDSSHRGDAAEAARRLSSSPVGRGRRAAMADLVAIGYPDQTTAARAMDEVNRLDARPAVAVIVRTPEGRFRVPTNPFAVVTGVVWGLVWGVLFGVFTDPVVGVPLGAGLGVLMGKVDRSGIDPHFQDQVRGLLAPATSALFVVVGKVPTDKAVAALGRYRGTVLKSSLSKDAERRLQEALDGETAR